MTGRAMRRARSAMVLLCTRRPDVSDLVTRQLVRRGCGVRSAPPGPLDAATVRPGEAFDLVVADLGDAEPELWRRATSLRATFPYVPLMLLSSVRPCATQLDRLHPCVYIRLPLAPEDLSAALDPVRSSLS